MSYYANVTVSYFYAAEGATDSDHAESFGYEDESSCKVADDARAKWSDLVTTWDGTWTIENSNDGNDYMECQTLRATCDRSDTARGSGPVRITFLSQTGD